MIIGQNMIPKGTKQAGSTFSPCVRTSSSISLSSKLFFILQQLHCLMKWNN